MSPRPLRVLIFGYINLNVVDGSAFFIPALARMIGERVGTSVDILSANKIHNFSVVDEIAGFSNIDLIDPFNSMEHRKLFDPKSSHTLSRLEAAEYIVALSHLNDYDSIIIRDLEVAKNVISRDRSLAEKVSAYVTGVPSIVDPIDPIVRADIRDICSAGCRLLVQTPIMLDKIRESVADIEDYRVLVLGPFVPDNDGELSASPEGDQFRSIYAGKFYTDWIPDKILSAFSAAKMVRPDLSMVVAGNAFKSSDGNPRFVRDVRWLLDNTPGVEWVGGVGRSHVRSLILKSHVGISWRSSRLDSSTEFSTKVIEYGALGVPSIVNPSLVNRSILGEDYPLYANTIDEFIELLVSLPESFDKLLDAGARVRSVASGHSYRAASSRLLPFIDDNNPFEKNESSSLTDVVKIQDSAVDIPPTGLTESLSTHNGELNERSGASYIVPSRTGDSSMRELVVETMVRNTVRTRVSRQLARMEVDIDCSESSDADVQVKRERDAKSRIDTNDREVAALRLEVEQLQRKVTSREKELATVTGHLEALRSSKLGRLQRWWWSRS